MTTCAASGLASVPTDRPEAGLLAVTGIPPLIPRFDQGSSSCIPPNAGASLGAKMSVPEDHTAPVMTDVGMLRRRDVGDMSLTKEALRHRDPWAKAPGNAGSAATFETAPLDVSDRLHWVREDYISTREVHVGRGSAA
jgi:hypothetical protein